jgi:SAM-dependent methyltransferase
MTMTVFDRRAVRRHRDRAAAGFAAHDFLVTEIAGRLADRLDDVKREFGRVLDLGAHAGTLRDRIEGRSSVDKIIATDLAPEMVRRLGGTSCVADEEALPFAGNTFDLVVSAMSLHWVNDLPGALIQIRNTLRPDGLFLAALLGGDTLFELRGALVEAESQIEGGVSPRISPFLDVREGGALLQRAGFALPVVDSDTITVTWPDALALMRDLRGMGETNAVAERKKRFTRRETLLAAAARYQDRHGDSDGRVPATFQVIYLTGWAPHESQQTALRPGAATTRLADALDVTEVPAGEKTSPGS